VAFALHFECINIDNKERRFIALFPFIHIMAAIRKEDR